MAPGKFSDKAREGESGFADRYLLTVAKSHFGFPFPNAADRCCLILKGERNIDGELSDGHLWLACGDFEPGDKEGTFAIHTSQDVTKFFNKRSKLGKFLKSADEVGLMDELENRIADDRAVYETRDALMWIGLTLDIEEKDEDYGKNKETGEQMTGRQPYIRRFSVSGEAPTSASGATTTAPAASATANGAISEDQAKLLAKASPNYLKYLEDVTAQGVDPGDEKASEEFFKKARA